jgi:hypothetical protein
MVKRVKTGDIIEIPTKNGLAYAQCTHKKDQWGFLIRVLPGFHSGRPASFSGLVDQKESFVTFFPVQQAVSRRIFRVAGHADVPRHARPFPLFRASGFVDREGYVHWWSLWDGDREWRVGALTPEQRKLPLRQVWNDTLLIQRIEEGWTPETDNRKERIDP